MKILGVSSIPTAVIDMVIGTMRADKGGSLLIEVNEGREGFWAFAPRSLAKKLKEGDRIAMVCVPSKGLEFSSEILALRLYEDEGSSSIIFDRDDYMKDFLKLR
jgi:hypothetical protein